MLLTCHLSENPSKPLFPLEKELPNRDSWWIEMWPQKFTERMDYGGNPCDCLYIHRENRDHLFFFFECLLTRAGQARQEHCGRSPLSGTQGTWQRFSDTTVKLTTASLTHPPPCFHISPPKSLSPCLTTWDANLSSLNYSNSPGGGKKRAKPSHGQLWTQSTSVSQGKHIQCCCLPMYL